MNMGLDDEAPNAQAKWESKNASSEQLILKESALKKKVKLLDAQIEKISRSADDPERQSRALYTLTFMGSSLGMKLDINYPMRPRKLRQNMKDELRVEMGFKHPNIEALWWCPIVRDFFHESSMITGHLFPSRSGDRHMREIFGPAELDRDWKDATKGKSELFRLWLKRGIASLVSSCNLKEYKIRVLKPESKEMKEPLSPHNPNPWNSINGRRVDFRTGFRPRARYVYWAYIEAMLNLSYTRKVSGSEHSSHNYTSSVARREVRRPIWASAGSYIYRNQLLGFVEELGHEYDDILANGKEIDDYASDETIANTGVTVAIEHILEKLRSGEFDDDSEDEEESADSDSDEEL
ncbi:MAG: hypothetical protein Q9191_005797 [Dirinaria sp. TL-2023a]